MPPTVSLVAIEAAIEIASAFCFRGEECGDLDAGDDVQDCIDVLVDLICLEEDCALEPAASDDEINQCVEDLGSADCEATASPSSCDGILVGF